MCGFIAWALTRQDQQSSQLLTSMTDLLAHRGPDGAGSWLGTTFDDNYQIGLGHRRLSIIDPKGGAQPMWTSDGNVGIVCNGEIYNYLELRDQLTTMGHTFKTSSDTEVLLEAYKAWGIGALVRLRGMFAFALWDRSNQRLILARDPFGEKPLFYAKLAGSWLFGSEINALLQFPGLDHDFDLDAVQEYLLNRYVPGPSTPFRVVKKLPPGCYGVWQNGSLSISRYYAPPSADVVPDIANFDQALALFVERFDQAVRIRMRSDAPFGAYLSGGIDSSSILSAMTKHSSAKIRTFSVGFSDPQYSELTYASDVARRFEADHHELVVNPDLFLKVWPEAVIRRGAPVSEPADVPILALSKAASSSVKMVLTGEGADELLGGYPKHRAERWIKTYQTFVPSTVHDNVISPVLNALPYGMRRVKTLALAAGERDLTNRMRVWFGGISVKERNNLLGRRIDASPRDMFPFSATTGSEVRRTMFFDQTSWLPDNLLERGDRMMMAASVEGRMPFLDVDLVAAVARFPDKYLVGKSQGKAILRAAMSKRLPMKILHRKKVGFRVPVGDWLRKPYREFVREHLLAGESQTRRFLDGATIDGLVSRHLDGRYNHEKVLWSLLNLELFFRAFAPKGAIVR